MQQEYYITLFCVLQGVCEKNFLFFENILLSFALAKESSFVYFSLLLQRKDTKRKQTETPFQKRGLRALPKRRGIRAQKGANASPHSLYVLTLTPSCAHSVRTLRGGYCF